MSGHSKWATTKHKKAVIDARRGKLFAKLIKNVEVAARNGGPDLAGNPTLYDAVQKAKRSSVPNDNIDRAMRRGGGLEAGGATYEAVTYEGYGPGGVAVLVECLTDNRNRAAAEVRTALSRNGGSMADPGSVSYLFSRKGVVIVPKATGVTEDDVLTAVLDAGAEEVNDLGDSFEVVSEATDLVAVRTALQEAGIDYESAEAAFLPSVEVPLDEEHAKRVFRLIEAIEDSDDVQDVYANYSVPDEVMEKLGHVRFRLAGHDRGGRVAYRLALDHLGRLHRMATLDIVPTYDMWHGMDANMAMKVWHWPFLAQPYPLPEMLIGKAPVEYLEWKMASWTKAKNLLAFDPRALEHYRASFSDPLRIHAQCEDYRAGAPGGADVINDEADRTAGKTISCPLLALWGGQGIANETGGPLKIWRQWAPQATGQPIDSGHFLTEENPDATAAALLEFFTAD